jgi:hypothetical protein
MKDAVVEQMVQTQSADMSSWSASGAWELRSGHLTVTLVDPPALDVDLGPLDSDGYEELVGDLVDAVAIERRYSDVTADLTPYRDYTERRATR